MVTPLPGPFEVTTYYEAIYEDVYVPGFEVLYAKSSLTMWIDVRFGEWIPHRFVAWYVDINGKLVDLLRGFNW